MFVNGKFEKGTVSGETIMYFELLNACSKILRKNVKNFSLLFFFLKNFIDFIDQQDFWYKEEPLNDPTAFYGLWSSLCIKNKRSDFHNF